jgi:hypothetical protein
MGVSRIRLPAGRFGRAALLATLGFGLGLAALTVGAHAQTAEQRAACTPDALRLCADAIPDVGRVTACMQAKRASLSARCQAAMPGPAPTIQTAAAPARAQATVKVATDKAAHGAAATVQPRRRVVTIGHRRYVVVAEVAPRHRRHVAHGGFGGGAGSRQGMKIAVQVMSALSAACQNQSMSSDVCGITNGLMSSAGGMGGGLGGGLGGAGGMGALAGFLK